MPCNIYVISKLWKIMEARGPKGGELNRSYKLHPALFYLLCLHGLHASAQTKQTVHANECRCVLCKHLNTDA